MRHYGYVYIMTFNLLKMKIGVTTSKTHRLAQIREATGEDVSVFFSLKVLFPYLVEKAMHTLFHPFHTSINCGRCDGYTEWFWNFGILSILAALLLSIIWLVEIVAILFPIFYVLNLHL